MSSFSAFVLVLTYFIAVNATDYYEGGNELGYGGGESGHEDYHEPAKYIFNYGVHDPHTGDQKQHVEERNGDDVKGIYTLKEADGTMRVVEYKADKHNGFQAVVHKLGHPKQEEQSYGGHGY